MADFVESVVAKASAVHTVLICEPPITYYWKLPEEMPDYEKALGKMVHDYDLILYRPQHKYYIGENNGADINHG